MWKCQFCEKMNFDDQSICPHCNAPNPAAPPPKPADPMINRAQAPQGQPYVPPQPPSGQFVPNPETKVSQAKKRDSIVKYIAIGAAVVSVLLMVTVCFQRRSGGTDVPLVTPTPTQEQSALAVAPVAEETLAPAEETEPEQASDPVYVSAAADVYLNFGETYQCSTEDFVLDTAIDEGDIVWSCDDNGNGTVCTTDGLITGGNTQVDVEKGYNDAITVKGVASDGSELSYNVIVGDGQTYDFSWSKDRRNMKNYNGAVILIDPMIINCDGFSIYYEYELTKGSLDTENWSVWVRENGTNWIRVKDIEVQNKSGEVYDIAFDEPTSFSEICVQPETYSDNYSYNDSFAVGYLVFN
jgi:hypothetical protein